MSNEQSASVSWRERLGLWSTAVQTLFGYDFFISYAWADGRPYAQELARRLAGSAPTFRCFLDQKDMGGGEAWRRSVFKALDRSAILVVVGSPTALERDAVFEEIATFSRTGRPIVPIDFDAGVAGIGTEHRLHRLIEERLRTDEPGGRQALAAGTVNDAVMEFLRHSFRFVRVHRIRMAVLSAVSLILVGLLVAALGGFVAARQGRLQAEARGRDATLAAVRIASGGRDYPEASRLIEQAPTLDRRLIWARWALQQHAAPAATTVDPFADKSFGMMRALSFHAATRQLAGLVTRKDPGEASACAAAVVSGDADLSRCGDEVHLVAFDPRTGAVGPMVRVADAASQLAAQPAPGEFLVAGKGTVDRYVLRDGQWHRTAFENALPQGAVTLFENEALGVMAEGGQLWELRFEGPRWTHRSLGSVDGPGEVMRSGDGRSALWAPREPSLKPRWLTVGSGGVSARPVAAAPSGVRMLGQGRIGWLDDDSRLHVRDLSSGFETQTRPLHVKPWLGLALVADEVLLVQEVADESQETRTRVAVLDMENGADLAAGFITREPINAIAVDARDSRMFLGGQGAWLTMAGLRTGGIRSLPARQDLEGPMAVVGGGAVEVRYANDVLERRRIRFDWQQGSAAPAQASYPLVSRQRGDTSWAHFHDCPALADVSPDGARIAFSGDALVVATLTPDERAQWRAGQLDLGGLCQRILDDERRVEWRPENLQPPQNLRWVSGSLLISHGYHGYAELLDASARKVIIPLKKDAMTALSRSGPVLVSTLAGRVYQVGSEGQFEVFGELPNLRALFPIDKGAEAFVAWMENPRRTAFVVRAEGRLQEVMLLTNTGIPRDARPLGDKLGVLYSRTLRLYGDLPSGVP